MLGGGQPLGMRMSGVKRDKDAHDDRVRLIAEFVADQDSDQDQYDAAAEERATYAVAFEAWRSGKLTGTAEEIFDAAAAFLDPTQSID
jgi:hypothetical protein